MSNRFEAMTDEDFDHSIGMYQAALARRGAEAKGWKRLAFDLIKAAGGTQRVSMLTVMNAHTEDTLVANQDPESGDMVYRVYRATNTSACESK